MKVQNNIKSLKKVLKNNNKEIDTAIDSILNNYVSDLVKFQEDLLMKICDDYDLSYEELHNKYIKVFKKNIKKTKTSNLIEIDDSEDEDIKNSVENSETETNVLEKVVINEIECYVENEEGGSIYNKEVIKIGEIKDGDYILYT